MRKVTLKEKGGSWENALDNEEEEEFRNLLRDLNELRKIRFPRCVQPLEGQIKRPLLLVFGDGSREACCTLIKNSYLHLSLIKVYCVWKIFYSINAYINGCHCQPFADQPLFRKLEEFISPPSVSEIFL